MRLFFINYYVKDGVNIATYVYSDGTEYFSPSQLYNMEQRNTQAEEDTQEYEESGDADYIDEEEETSEEATEAETSEAATEEATEEETSAAAKESK